MYFNLRNCEIFLLTFFLPVCGNGQDVSITIKEQEQYWNDISRSVFIKWIRFIVTLSIVTFELENLAWTYKAMLCIYLAFFPDFSHNRQWNWQLVYFVHYKNHLISSQSHSSIDTSKLDFSWTNVYNVTYHLVKASGGWWKFSRSFHLWTEEHLTVNTEAMDKIRLVLLQAWYKMNVRSGE